MTKLSTTIIAAITITLLAASVNTALAAIVDVRPDHDNFTRPSEPDTVQPHEGNLALGYDTIFFKFDIAALGGVNLVNSATLKLRTRNDHLTSNTDVQVYEVADDTWLETTITPNNKPALGNLIASYDAEAATTLGISPGTSQLDDVDVTSFVQSNIDNGDFLISIAMNDIGNSLLFIRGDEHSVQTEHPWARLVVNASSVPEPATLSLLGMGGLGLLRRRRVA
ncbi:MAG: DNRLRE domain-containing protein [Phycisphaeraceae bacterium]|nr:DNRLRE domain-containing protein [Phycisphaeraceae bacterium]